MREKAKKAQLTMGQGKRVKTEERRKGGESEDDGGGYGCVWCNARISDCRLIRSKRKESIQFHIP